VSARERIAFPLDVCSLDEARGAVGALVPHVGVFKVGLELFTRAGPEAVRMVHAAGAACFLDLKLHDISETVARAVEAACELEVRFLTVHASNGARCLERAARAAQGSRTTLLAVTVLTSLEDADLAAIGLHGPASEAVKRLAAVAVGAGVRGLVCSPREVAALRAAHGASVTLVVPGVRPAGADPGDQRRVATPEQAIEAGADLLVVGRPIRDAADPAAAAAAIGAAIETAVRRRGAER
jgi:orotidine-5'-phosphate decarboxylase